VLQANNASFTGYNNQAALSSNYYYNAGNKYIASGYATQYSQSSGQHIWYTAPSGTAGAAISFTQAMTLDASGNLAVGTTSYRTPASYTAFALNGTVGSLIDLYAGGTRYGGLATISSAVTLSSITSIPLVFSTNDTERARITSGGDFFIGNGETAASPSAGILSATGGTGTNIAGANLTIRGGASTGTGAGGVIIFSTAAASGTSGTATNSATERARITSGGDLLVGTTDSSGMSGAGFKTLSGRPVVVNAASANTTAVYDVYSTGGSAYRFYVGMGGTIYATSTTITAISDQRLKENIQDIDVGLDKIMALKPRKFDWKEGKGKDKKGDRGWIAQEFEQVFPDMITTWKDEPPEGEEPYKAVNADLIPVLVKAIQEQQTLITSLTARVAALEGTQP
jgi:hypothetical protein